MNTSLPLHPVSSPLIGSSPFQQLKRRDFLWRAAALAGGCAVCLASKSALGGELRPMCPNLVSPGCRASKVAIARIYLGKPKAHWPTPKLDLDVERRVYEAYFAKHEREFRDVEFLGNQLITDKAQLAGMKEQLANADGVLLMSPTSG